ncbi:lysoplasmalogenase family protein [Ligaoa zhengdingensis]|uniref:lysoplasmalogenase family protein n=3 Tax=Ligaoa zhengdingensis TaxID=2763658 RepID=UPI0031BA94F9
MMIAYLLVSALALSLCFYFFSLYRNRQRIRVLSKAITSLLFVAIAVAACWVADADRHYFIYLLIALALCTFGDVFLEISKTDELGINYFIYALISFFSANVAFLILFCSIAGVFPLDFFVSAAVLALLALGARLLRIDFLNMHSYVTAYALTAIFMFVKSLSLLYGAGAHLMRNQLVALGGGLFFLSNLLYAFYLFLPRARNRTMEGVGAAVYYTGQTLIALSILFAG